MAFLNNYIFDQKRHTFGIVKTFYKSAQVWKQDAQQHNVFIIFVTDKTFQDFSYRKESCLISIFYQYLACVDWTLGGIKLQFFNFKIIGFQKLFSHPFLTTCWRRYFFNMVNKCTKSLHFRLLIKNFRIEITYQHCRHIFVDRFRHSSIAISLLLPFFFFLFHYQKIIGINLYLFSVTFLYYLKNTVQIFLCIFLMIIISCLLVCFFYSFHNTFCTK